VPGGSSMVAMNQVYNTAAKDGTVIGTVSGGLVLQQLFGAAGVQYDVTRVHYLGTPSGERRLLIATRASGVTRFADVLDAGGKPLVLGSPPPGTGAHDAPAVVKDVLGANIRLVSGYDGLAKVRLAMEQGEVDGFVNTWESVKASGDLARIESGEWVVLAQLTEAQQPALLVGPGKAQDLGSVGQLLDRRFGAIATSQIVMLNLVAPGVPPDRAQALEVAFARTMADPDFQAEAERGKVTLEPLSGPQLQAIVGDFLGLSDDVKATLKGILLPAGS
jgi:tripartite-type tricarboxylate transporter receptor subunit TctC